MSTHTSVQKSSYVSLPKTIKCDLSYSMLLAFAHCDLAFTEDSLQSVPMGRKSPGMLQSVDLASTFLLPEYFCNNSLVGCTVYTFYNGSTSQHKQDSFNIGTTNVQLTNIKFGLMPSEIALLPFAPCYLRLKTFRAASISNEFHGRYSLFLAWIPFCQSNSVSSTTSVLLLVFICIHNDGARNWEPCWLIWIFVNTFDQAHYFWEYHLPVKRFSLFVCMIWTL